jgi:catechol 2,3-dioxygenase-like lactoylglutathione lyase family enzyme
MHQYLSGIQQIGIGVTNAQEAMHLYNDIFGMNVLVFDDEASAKLMTQYTGNKVYNRRAILTMNLKGGGGFEIWQYKDKEPHKTSCKIGDIGIFAAILKTDNLIETYKKLNSFTSVTLSEIISNESQPNYFWVTDTYSNSFKIIESDNWFQKTTTHLGGVVGAVIGVSDMSKSLHFYQNVLAIEEVLYDYQFTENGIMYHKVGLSKKETNKGAFNKLLGNVTIELVQIINQKAPKIYENRFWGDCGFIHLCFDVLHMSALKSHAQSLGFNFTVDSDNAFEMDNASGRFCYIEDVDGTLIELVETHKVPILKKIGWYLDLRKRNVEKPLPKWMVKLLGISKVK